jgi:hypothetical protein
MTYVDSILSDSYQTWKKGGFGGVVLLETHLDPIPDCDLTWRTMLRVTEVKIHVSVCLDQSPYARAVTIYRRDPSWPHTQKPTWQTWRFDSTFHCSFRCCLQGFQTHYEYVLHTFRITFKTSNTRNSEYITRMCHTGARRKQSNERGSKEKTI